MGDSQSMRNNRFGILQAARGLSQFQGMEVFVVDLGVSEYANFLPGMVGNDRSRVINFYNLGIDESSRMLLDQICTALGDPFGRTGTEGYITCSFPGITRNLRVTQ